MQYARIFKGQVAEVFTPPSGFTLQECFHPDVVAQFVAAPDDVATGWSYVDGIFLPPDEPTP
jgi:hypothetical protein